MKHPAMMLVAVLAAVLVVSVSAFPARTAPQTRLVWETAPPQTLQSAGVHAMVGASFHAATAGY
jgi:hypothetical protein